MPLALAGSIPGWKHSLYTLSTCSTATLMSASVGGPDSVFGTPCPTLNPANAITACSCPSDGRTDLTSGSSTMLSSSSSVSSACMSPRVVPATSEGMAATDLMSSSILCWSLHFLWAVGR